MNASFRKIMRAQVAFLSFRPLQLSLRDGYWRWFTYVLVVTWLAGVGRYWDHPSAETWQYLGVGSLVYIFCLSTLLFLLVWPLKPSNWTIGGVFIFVGLTSLPALLYAIPVERVVDLKTAQSINAWFLGIVAAWRVALLFRYLIVAAKLHWFVATTVSVLLLSGIVVTLTLLNLEHVVFDLMAGIRAEDASPNDVAYLVVFVLAFFSMWAFPVALALYLGAIVHRRRPRSHTLISRE